MSAPSIEQLQKRELAFRDVCRGVGSNRQRSATDENPAYRLRVGYYSANDLDAYRRAARYIDKILKGTKPADIPVEQPMKFEFVINLKTAKQIGLNIPQSVLFRADKVIQ